MRIIFLDVDGVLNSKSYKSKMKIAHAELPVKKEELLDIYICDSMLNRLEKLYKKFSDTVLVLSSGWKELDPADPKWNYLNDKLEERGMKIYDCTPFYFDESGELCDNRPQEIGEWLRMHEDFNIKNWVSLDDDYDYDDYENAGKGFSFHLCKTEYGELTDRIIDTGFTNLKYHTALEILGGRLN